MYIKFEIQTSIARLFSVIILTICSTQYSFYFCIYFHELLFLCQFLANASNKYVGESIFELITVC